MSLIKSQGQLAVIAIVIILGIVIVFLPTKSADKAEVINTPKTVNKNTSPDEKIKTAIEIITNGKGAPMKGIALLKEVIEADPKNIEALYYLGVFSIQSGQFNKGIQRFEKILEINPLNEEARFLLSKCLIGNEQPNEAKIELNKIMQSEAPKELKDKAIKLIEEI